MTVDHHHARPAVPVHVHDLRAIRELLADVEVAHRVGRALDAPVVAIQEIKPFTRISPTE